MKICPKTGKRCDNDNCPKYGCAITTPYGTGIVSPSMNVNTKPAHRIEIDGYWVLIDPSMPDEVFERFKRKLEL
jgi:hypothetical protein